MSFPKFTKMSFIKPQDHKLYYFRTYDKQEIDLIVDRKTHQDFIEIKKSSTFKTSMIKTLKDFTKPDNHLFLIYQGEKDHYKDVTILPYGDYLSP